MMRTKEPQRGNPAALLDPSQFPRVKLVLWKLLYQSLQKLLRPLLVVLPQGRNGPQHARVWFEVVTPRGGKLQLFDAGPLIGLRSVEFQQPSDRRRVKAQNVVFDADR
jgi:hypothetical protein